MSKFIPYNEKIKRLVEGEYPISWFVNLHKYELQFIGELRNHITHGIKLDGHNYAIPSPYALEKIKNLAHHIKSPPSCFDIFKKTVFFSKTTDKLKDILSTMKYRNYSHVPVYDHENHFVGVLTDSSIAFRLMKQLEK
ncbi:MAG: CBS domain-containing protein [bacterium]|nr:CBS domain-containing protein [bacterium]